MYRQIALLSLLAAAAVAQIPGLPSCAQGCVTNYGGCSQVDVECICKNTQLLETLSCCVSQKCDAQGQQDVISFADSLCGGYGVSTLPTAATCASTAASTATSTATGTTSRTSTGGSMSITATGSAASSLSSALQSASSAASSAASAASSAASSASAAATESGSAGHVNKVEGGLLGMVVAGLVAAL